MTCACPRGRVFSLRKEGYAPASAAAVIGWDFETTDSTHPPLDHWALAWRISPVTNRRPLRVFRPRHHGERPAYR